LTVSSVAQDLCWPREKSTAGSKIIYYQPQLDDWKDFRQLEARMAVSLRPVGGQPTPGVIYLRARTDANLDTRNVVISRLEITGTRFPSLDEGSAAKMDQLVRSRHQSLKFSYSRGAFVTIGGAFQNISVAWQYSWLGRPN
jgi:hypothetical protein